MIKSNRNEFIKSRSYHQNKRLSVYSKIKFDVSESENQPSFTYRQQMDTIKIIQFYANNT